MKNIAVIYHNDHDGFGGAWAAWKIFKDSASYIAVEHNGGPPEGLKDKEIYIVDFCYSEKEMEKILENNKRLTVIDHHVTQKEEIMISTDYFYGEENSAAVLAWKYFHKEIPVPKILLYVEDLDLYKFKLPNSKEISAFLDLCNFDFLEWEKLEADFENSEETKKIIEKGEIILKYQEKIIELLVKGGDEVIFEGEKAFAVNSPILNSKIGEFIYKNKKTIGIIYKIKNGEIVVSLRSDNIDVAKIAEKNGGGGHKRASGFSFDSKINFPWEKIK